MEEAPGGYSPIVMDHFTHPRNMGEMEDPDGIGEAQNPVCGDTMRLFIKVEMDRVIDAKFLTFGCSAAIASSSITSEIIKGKTIEELLKISNKMVMEALGGLPPTKIHAAMLAEQAINAAVLDYRKKTPSPHPSFPRGEGWGEGHGKKGEFEG
jgi:nitrogen fixation NifU-like protein